MTTSFLALRLSCRMLFSGPILKYLPLPSFGVIILLDLPVSSFEKSLEWKQIIINYISVGTTRLSISVLLSRNLKYARLPGCICWQAIGTLLNEGPLHSHIPRGKMPTFFCDTRQRLSRGNNVDRTPLQKSKSPQFIFLLAGKGNTVSERIKVKRKSRGGKGRAARA